MDELKIVMHDKSHNEHHKNKNKNNNQHNNHNENGETPLLDEKEPNAWNKFIKYIKSISENTWTNIIYPVIISVVSGIIIAILLAIFA
jgi:hypothetical protein